MGVDWYAYSFIGVEINPKNLHEKRRERACDCPPSESKFCPHCGKPATLEKYHPVNGFDESSQKLFGFQLVYSTDMERAFVACGEVADASYGCMCNMLPPPDVSAGKEALRAVLEPLGMWNESRFGMWSVLTVSY